VLNLSRKVGEKIRVGDDVTLSVLEIRGDRVRIGVEAPREVSVLRGELPRPAGGEGRAAWSPEGK
jgi:carbon storage regulator